jgi:4-hydroxybenzoate polyprenyltransferase
MTPSHRPWIAVITFGRMVKFSHTVFALPFALAAVALAARGHGVTVAQIAAIVLAMVGARTAAMGFNPHRRPPHRRGQPAYCWT